MEAERTETGGIPAGALELAVRSARALARVPAALVLAGSCGCAAQFEPYPLPETPLCGGAVCFEPTDVRVEQTGQTIVVSTWHASDAGCALPHGGDAPVGGSAIEITVVTSGSGPALGVPLPVVSAWQAVAAPAPHVSARAFRIDPRDGRAVSDEEAVTGEATIELLDVTDRHVKLALHGRWSSGVEGTMQLDVDTATHACAQ